MQKSESPVCDIHNSKTDVGMRVLLCAAVRKFKGVSAIGRWDGWGGFLTCKGNDLLRSCSPFSITLPARAFTAEPRVITWELLGTRTEQVWCVFRASFTCRILHICFPIQIFRSFSCKKKRLHLNGPFDLAFTTDSRVHVCTFCTKLEKPHILSVVFARVGVVWVTFQLLIGLLTEPQFT